jgi:glycosyltransferase involved in cell wall biosynthesis
VNAAAPVAGLRVVIVNWRDPWQPEAGGAEQYAWQMARGLAARGAVVRYLTARAPGQPRHEQRDGIAITRLGGRFTVYPLALGWLLAHRRSFGAVLDCQNGIPFFTPCVLPRRVPVLCVVHHVHTAQFLVHFPPWLARVGQFLEGPAARLAYRRHACVAVSPSTVTAMRERLRWRGPVYVVPNGAPEPADPAGQADPAGPAADQAAGQDPATLVWVGRLVAHKRAGLLIPLAERLRDRGVAIDVIGRGPDAAALAAGAADRGLDGVLRLRGYLPEEDKRALVAGARLHLNTSQGEGWGLCVLEAAAQGVPTVAFDVDGLRDAVRDGQTGWLVRAGESLEDVTERALKELSDPARRAEVAAACRAWAAQLTWADSVARTAALIGAAVRAGSAQGRHDEAWIVSVPGRGGVLAEGPVLDELLRQHPDAALARPATGPERLLGRPAGPL